MKSDVVFGNPGTGKTYELVERIKKCKEQGYTEKEIQVLSHTRTAAGEIARRAEGALSNTIHSLAYRYCDISRQQVVTIPELRKFSEKIGIPMKGVSGDGTQLIEAGDEYMTIINRACNMMMEPVDLARREMPIIGNREEFLYFYLSYKNWKTTFGLIDFNDMLFRALDLLVTKKYTPDFKILFIDEAQDLSHLQWSFIYELISKGNIHAVTVTGDPDQALFIWGGASTYGMQNFSMRYTSSISELTQSYRVPQEVWRLSNKIIKRSKNRYAKDYKPTKIRGDVIHVLNASHINWSSFSDKDVLVLYRTHSLRKEIETEIRRFNVPYVTLNGRPGLFQNNTGLAVKTFEKICNNEVVTSKELINLKNNATTKCANLIDKKDFDGIRNLTRNTAITFPAYSAAYYINTDFNLIPTIKLSTIHGAKGMEADYVFLLDGLSPRVLEGMETNLDDELKVWFVGVTRSRNKLYWVNSMDAEGFKI